VRLVFVPVIGPLGRHRDKSVAASHALVAGPSPIQRPEVPSY